MTGTLAETSDFLVTESGDFLPHMPLVSGFRALAQRIAMRLSTPRGRIPFIGWEDFGTDLRQFLLSKAPPSEIVFAVEAELGNGRDEQIESAICTPDVAAFTLDNRVLPLSIRVFTPEGPFTLTMTITEAGAQLVDIIRQQQV